MKKKNKFFVSIILCLTLLFSGCPDDRYVLFGDSLDGNNIVEGEVENINLTFQPSEGYTHYRVFVEVNGSIVNSSTAPCKAIPTSTPKRVSYELEGTNVGDILRLRVNLYANNQCMATQTYSSISEVSNKYTVVSSAIGSDVDQILKLVGGESQYCNIDASGNYNISASKNKFVNIAYSQIGYREKKSGSKNINSCTADSGTGDYQKYGPNGSKWCNYFIHWCLKKAEIKAPFSDTYTVANIYSWAKNNQRLYTSTSKRHDGDLVILNSQSHIGIIYQDNGVWYIIHGNWTRTSAGNNYTGVHIGPVGNSTYNTNNITGYVNMSGITY